RADDGFSRSPRTRPAQQDQGGRETAAVELDAPIGSSQRLLAQHARPRDRGAEHHDGVRWHQLRRDGRPLVQPIGERAERGDEETDNGDETDHAAHALAATGRGVHTSSFCRLPDKTKKSGSWTTIVSGGILAVTRVESES